MAITSIKHGGLMRCCVSTITEMSDEKLASYNDGDIISCKYEEDNNTNMIVVGNAVEWNRPESIKNQFSTN
jgi:hypothetical protein